MKTEKIVISFIAVTIGILVAAGAFYFYQTTKIVSTSDTKSVSLSASITPTQFPKPAVVLSIDAPKDEDVIDTKTVTITGKTNPDVVIVVTTSTNDQVVTPAANGNFSTTAILGSGENAIEIRAIAQNGEETNVTRTVTVSTESF